jgi:hypothetical protein
MNNEMVTVATFSNQNEAQIARGFLESCGIEAFIGDENMSRMENPVFIGGAKLRVRSEDADTARRLLASVKSDSGGQ